MKVSDVMTKDVVTVRTSTTIRELAELFNRHRFGSLPVVDDNNNLLGIVTETDLIEQDKNLHIPTVISLFDWVIYLESEKRFETELRKMTAQTVIDIFTDKVQTVTCSTPIHDAADIMCNNKYHSLPVVENGKLIGIISRIDIIRSMIELS